MSVFPYEHVRPLALLKKSYNFFIVRKKTEDINLGFNKLTKSDRLHTEGY